MHLNYAKLSTASKIFLILCSITSKLASLNINIDCIRTGTIFYYMHNVHIQQAFHSIFPLERKKNIFRTEHFDCLHPTDCVEMFQYNALDRLKQCSYNDVVAHAILSDMFMYKRKSQIIFYTENRKEQPPRFVESYNVYRITWCVRNICLSHELKKKAFNGKRVCVRIERA